MRCLAPSPLPYSVPPFTPPAALLRTGQRPSLLLVPTDPAWHPLRQALNEKVDPTFSGKVETLVHEALRRWGQYPLQLGAAITPEEDREARRFLPYGELNLLVGSPSENITPKKPLHELALAWNPYWHPSDPVEAHPFFKASYTRIVGPLSEGGDVLETQVLTSAHTHPSHTVLWRLRSALQQFGQLAGLSPSPI